MKELLTVVARAAGGLGEPAVVYEHRDVLVIKVGEVIVKSHHPATRDLEARLAVAAAHPGILLRPLGPLQTINGHRVSSWPLGEPVDPGDPARAPWEEGGRLLAALHSVPPPPGLPRQGAPDKVREIVLTRLETGHPAAKTVRRAFDALPAVLEVPGRNRVVHGDWHLGQLVRHAGGWRLIDLDDLGVGDPVWDLARPAALFAAGILPPEVWSRFLHSYQEAGGVALPPGTDPWELLDLPAKALAIQTAARCVSHAVEEDRSLDAYETALIDTCDRIGGLPAA
ncbi:aminoglycoside phosphotransferase family protein [Actinocorallia longicatena]|uniref:Aminoglycoside phosphotransferase family protein n=1 Tax=Actinocorallia longicatena TaxID=111803 RepID=A0ABP6QBK7_9ACTN